MPRDQTTSRISHSELVAFEMRLEAALATVRRARDVTEQAGTDEIWTFRRWSLENGLKAVESFAVELQKSSIALASGNPLTAETSKTQPKKSAKKKTAAKKPRK